MESFVIRPYEPDDAPALAKLLYTVWPYGVSDPALGYWKGLYDLSLELQGASLALVAVAASESGAESKRTLSPEGPGSAASFPADEPLGIIVARDPSLGDAGYESRAALHEAARNLAKSEEGTRAMAYLQEERAIHDELVAQREDPFACEITLLVNAPTVRGQGLGTALLHALLKELAARGVAGVHLYTDTFCDWQFYERKGFTRTAEKPIAAGQKDAEPAVAFLYEKSLKNFQAASNEKSTLRKG